jgi:phosphoribosylglycinamide formyltransferase-1
VTGRVAVLVSGSGTNLQALLDDPVVGRRIGLVVSSRPGAYALERANAREIEAIVVDPGDHPDRETHDAALLTEMERRSIGVVLLAGYMRILNSVFVAHFENRILNIHPSLLPAFPGAHAERDAIAYGVRVSGVTVHLVWDQVDHGPIVLQEPVIVLPDDDEDSLHRRVQEVEHRLYPRAARLLLEGRLKVDGRRVDIMEPAE